MSMQLRAVVATALLGVLLELAPVAVAQVVIPPIAPPKPAVPRAANALVISTGDLNESVNWARQAMLADAATSFDLFKEDWSMIVDEVRQQSEDIAARVDDAIGQVQDVLDTSPSPDQAAYYPMLQTLQQVVEDANTELGIIAPPTAAVRINPVNLAQSVNWASKGNLVKTHDEFRQFLDDWGLAQPAVRPHLGQVAAGIDVAIGAVRAIIEDPSRPMPAPSEYLPALQSLRQAVADANVQLAALPPLSAAELAAAPLKIHPGNLGEAVDFANDANLSSARSEFRQFQGDWSKVKVAVRDRSPVIADQVEAAIASTQAIISASDPARDEYLAALKQLQRLVEDVNAKLAQ